ncbi:HNH endonuclease [Ferrimonas sediminum]|uniref:HNH endonuclease n=1 Tax=Ferrimonas sediminum TaxID=718193 RepID=A0A1G8UE32_9GAMM|nr:HNH endonuclease domain-containing protein [Ferrimonas sediminum]SDJ51991.1 HNH endonuclease [Ferrimonas sediminum]
MSSFVHVEPTLENQWRAIILFGRNVASYKFALAKSLHELAGVNNDLVRLDQLAEPFSRHICAHLGHSPKQATSRSSKFLEACGSHNRGDISDEQLIGLTTKLGFANVIDAFHNVNGSEVPQRFFIDERKTHGGIRLTEQFYQLSESVQFASMNHETEARWRLVEEGWKMGVSRSLIRVDAEPELDLLFTGGGQRRVAITSCRDSLNGYQKGRCFYCYDEISVEPGHEKLADVDHFLPWALGDSLANPNGVWNLVLACRECNRGEGGKFARVPTLGLLKRLHNRNEYLIGSHLPLRETLIQQTGQNGVARQSFLQGQYQIAKEALIHEWEPPVRGVITF